MALQPIVDLETGAWVAVEALARFPDNRPPDQWFTEAHEAGIGIRWSGWPWSVRCRRCRSCRPA